MKTDFNLVNWLASWFHRKDASVNTGGRDINTSGGDVIVGVGTVDGVDLTAHVADTDAHHNRSHALDSGSDHTGTLPWNDLNKTGSDLADLATRAHSDLTGVTANQHHNESHTVASHSDTTATGSELNTLTDGSDASSLHDHDGRYYQESEFSSNTGATSKPLKTDSGGELIIDRITVSDALATSGSGLLVLVERSTPGTASTGTIRVYAKADGKLYFKNDGGTEFEVATV